MEDTKCERASFNGIVYLITNLINGKKYVGCSVGMLEKRWKRHLSDAKKGAPYLLHRAIRKYGSECFTVEVLQVTSTRVEMFEAEMQHISSQGSVIPTGYNMTRGGEGVDFSGLETKGAHLKAVRKLATDPVWRQKNRTVVAQLSKDPNWLRKVTEAAVLRSQDPEWRSATSERCKEYPNSSVWRKSHLDGCKKRSASPEWLIKNEKTLQKLHTDPAVILAHRSAMKKMAEDPTWKDRHKEMIRKRGDNPTWKAKQQEVLKGIHAKATLKAQERDALCSPEERLRRIKKREYQNRRYQIRKNDHTR